MDSTIIILMGVIIYIAFGLMIIENGLQTEELPLAGLIVAALLWPLWGLAILIKRLGNV